MFFGGNLHHRLATFYMVNREDKRTNNRIMLPALKNNAAIGYQGPVKIELLKGAGLLVFKLTNKALVALESGQTCFPNFVSTHPSPPTGATLFSGVEEGRDKSRNRRLLSRAWRQVILVVKSCGLQSRLCKHWQ